MNSNGVPFYQQLKEKILLDIEAGKLQMDTKIPSSAELCRMHGVSMITVRRAIEDLKSAGILRGEFGKGVYVNRIGEVTSDNNTAVYRPQKQSICFIYPTGTDGNTICMAEGLKRFFQNIGMKLEIVGNLENEMDGGAGMLLQLPSIGNCGAIIQPSSEPGFLKAMTQLIDSGFPVICVDREIPGIRASVVESDNLSGAYQATLHLIEEHRRPVHFLTVDKSVSSVKNRMQGFLKAMINAGMGAEVESHIHYFRDKTCIVDVEKMLKEAMRDGGPACVLCLHDMIAADLYVVAARNHWSVGKDIFVVGFDDLPLASMLEPALTTVRQPFVEIGVKAGELMHHLLKGTLTAPINVKIPVELVVRESSRVMADTAVLCNER